MAKKIVEMPVGGGRKATVPSDPAPTWTLSAAHRFDMLAMVLIVDLATAGSVENPRLKAMQERLREFEMYEERHR
jgi:hypothetical protein